jgi:predicted deacylase
MVAPLVPAIGQCSVTTSIKQTLFNPAAGAVTLLVKAGDTAAKGQFIVDVDSPELLNLQGQETVLPATAKTNFKRQQIQIKKKACMS